MGSSRIIRFVGVYHAGSRLRDKLAYSLDKLAGRGSCALCDITHGWVGEKPAMAGCRAALPVPFEALHLDELDAAQSAACAGHTPCVLALTEAGWAVALDTAALQACGGRVEALEARLLAVYSA